MENIATQTVVVTGGNGGLGSACASVLAAQPGYAVVIASRNRSAGAQVAAQLRAATGNQQIVALPLDLASLDSVRAFPELLEQASLPPLGGLVCNAGIQVVAGTTYTVDGFETTFGVNHLGHFLLANLLHEQLRGAGRIVFVSSGTHDPNEPAARLFGGYAPRFRSAEAMAYPQRFPDPAEQGENPVMTGRHRYGTSKLCNIFCTYEMARRFAEANSPVTVNAFDPGLMPGTELAREAGPIAQFAWKRVLPLLSDRVPRVHTTATSGANLARLVCDPALSGVSGRYFVGRTQARSSAESYDEAKARDLWDASAGLVGLNEHVAVAG